MKILVINGPNLNLLGIREVGIYGKQTYDDLVRVLKNACPECDVVQSNHEGDLIDYIQSALGQYDGIVINPGGYTHTSIAIADAIRAVALPTVEVHLSDITKREEYRKISYTSEACLKTFMGRGFDSYLEALEFLLEVQKQK